MSFGEQLVATLVGGGIAVVAGVVVHWLTARHEREEAKKAWERQRRDVRADAQRTAVIELQDALRGFRTSVISLADADIEVMQPRDQGSRSERARTRGCREPSGAATRVLQQTR